MPWFSGQTAQQHQVQAVPNSHVTKCAALSATGVVFARALCSDRDSCCSCLCMHAIGRALHVQACWLCQLASSLHGILAACLICVASAACLHFRHTANKQTVSSVPLPLQSHCALKQNFPTVALAQQLLSHCCHKQTCTTVLQSVPCNELLSTH